MALLSASEIGMPSHFNKRISVLESVGHSTAETLASFMGSGGQIPGQSPGEENPSGTAHPG